jgi:hypothetical protein
MNANAYRDEACSVPVFSALLGPPADALYVVDEAVPNSCDTRTTRWYKPGDALSPDDTYYTTLGGSCVAPTGPLKRFVVLDPYAADPVDSSTVIQSRFEHAPGGRLSRVRLVMDGGARLESPSFYNWAFPGDTTAYDFFDETLQTACDFVVTAAGWRCLPPSLTGGIRYRDAACTEPVAVVDASQAELSCVQPSIVGELFSPGAYYRVGDAIGIVDTYERLPGPPDGCWVRRDPALYAAWTAGCRGPVKGYAFSVTPMSLDEFVAGTSVLR